MIPGFRWPHELTSGGQAFIIWSSLSSASFYFKSHTWTYIHTQIYISESVSYHTHTCIHMHAIHACRHTFSVSLFHNTHMCICKYTDIHASVYFIPHTCIPMHTETHASVSLFHTTYMCKHMCTQTHMFKSVSIVHCDTILNVNKPHCT